MKSKHIIIAAFSVLVIFCLTGCAPNGLTNDTNLIEDMQWTTGICADQMYEYPASMKAVVGDDELDLGGYAEYEDSDMHLFLLFSDLANEYSDYSTELVLEHANYWNENDYVIIDNNKHFEITTINDKDIAIAYGNNALDSETGEKIAYVEVLYLEEEEENSDSDLGPYQETQFVLIFKDNDISKKDWQIASKIINSIRTKDTDTEISSTLGSRNHYAAYVKLLSDNLAAMSSESIKANKGSQMTALFDIDGDSIEELFAFIPNDDGIPVLHIFSYDNEELIDIVFDYYDRFGQQIAFEANIAGVENKYTIFQSKDKSVLYIYNSDVGNMEKYEAHEYAILDHFKLNEAGNYSNYFYNDEQSDEYYEYSDAITKEQFVKKFNAAANDMGEVIMNTADDNFAIAEAAKNKKCNQKTYEEMIDYLIQAQ